MSSDVILSIFDSVPLWAVVSPILLCSIVVVAVIIERLIFFRKINKDYRSTVKKIIRLVKEKKYSEAADVSSKVGGPIANIFISFIVHIQDTEKEIAIEEASEKAIYSVEKYIGVISTIATVAPMLGLLGTVTGMMKSFNALAAEGGPVIRDLLAHGISEALITTAMGLIVAIPALIYYNFMVSKAEYFIKEIEFSANCLMELISSEKI